MDDFEVLIAVVLLGVVWLISKYHWLRIITCGFLLAAWGIIPVMAPVLAFMSFSKGDVFTAIVQLGFGAFMAWFWWGLGVNIAQNWVKREIKQGIFWKPWNAE